MADLGYPRAPQPLNPLAVMSQMMQLNALSNQNQLFQQEFADRAAANRAYQQALDPQTGEIDYMRLSQALAGGGFGRLLPEVIRNQQESQKRQLDVNSAQFDLARKKADAAYGALSTIINKPDLTRKDALDAASRLVAQGTHKISELMPILQGLPEGGPELKQAIDQIFLQTLDSRERFARMTPNVQALNVGGQTVFPDLNPVTNPGIVGAAIQNTLDPGTATSPTSVLIRNPDGTYSQANVTRQQFAQMSAQGPVTTAPPLTASGLTPEAASQIVDYFDEATRTVKQITRQEAINRMMGGGAVSARPSGGAQGPGGPVLAPTVGGGGLPKGPPLGASEAAAVSGTKSAEALAALREGAGTAPQRIFQLEQAELALANPKVETGPGSETFNTMKAFLQNFGGKYVNDPEAIKDYETARKYLTQYAIGQAGSLGQGTDSKLAAAFTGNPNTSMTKLAAQDLIKSAVGLERMQQAVALAWDQSGQNPEKFDSWRTGFVKDLDPRVFVFDKLPEEKRQKLIADVAKMPKAEKDKFAKSYNLAVQTGIIPDLYGAKQ